MRRKRPRNSTLARRYSVVLTTGVTPVGTGTAKEVATGRKGQGKEGSAEAA